MILKYQTLQAMGNSSRLGIMLNTVLADQNSGWWGTKSVHLGIEAVPRIDTQYANMQDLNKMSNKIIQVFILPKCM